MDFKRLKNVVEKDLRLKIEGSNGLAVFSKESSKFENWLQVELAGAIAKETHNRKRIIPEAHVKLEEKEYSLDLLIEDEWAIELKVISEEDKAAGAAATVDSLKQDIAKLRAVKKIYSDNDIDMNTAFAFVVFPAEPENMAYRHENMLSEALESMDAEIIDKKTDFYFHDNSMKGTIYLAEVR